MFQILESAPYVGDRLGTRLISEAKLSSRHKVEIDIQLYPYATSELEEER